MKEYLKVHDIANTIRMTRSLHKGVFLVVEGDTDARVYKRFVNEVECKVIPAHNKDNAIKVIEMLERENVKGILVIVDADFLRLEEKRQHSTNLVFTDTHDLETMILSTTAVQDKILAELGSSNRIKRLPRSAVAMVLNATLPIGFLRWLASPARLDLHLKFMGLTFENFVDKTKLKTNIDKLIVELLNNTGNANIDDATAKTIRIEIKKLEKAGHDPWQVCSGHDMIKIFSIGLCFVFGNKKAKSLAAELLESSVRMAYEIRDFRLTGLYRSIKDWEKENPPFKILNP